MGCLKEGYVFSPGHPSEDELAGAEAFGREVAARASAGEYGASDDDRPASIVYRLERFATNRWLARNLYSRLFRVDADACTACGICMELCPVGNIGKSDDGRPVWGHDCLLCMTCELKCPEEVIVSPASWPIMRPVMRYNARLAARDPCIDHVRVDPQAWAKVARGEVGF